MSEFDFLSRVPLGQYIATNSFIHKLDPRAKIIIFSLLVIAITFTPSRLGLGIGIAFLLCALLISKVKIGYALKGLLPPLPFLVIIAIIQILFYSPESDSTILFTLGPIHPTLAGILVGLLLLIRFAALILAISLATFCISTSELIQGLSSLFKPLSRIGIPMMDVIMVIQITLRFLPFMAQSMERIAKAQASRGAGWGMKKQNLLDRVKQVTPLLIPLFLISLRRAENLALAMDARAYGIKKDRTSLGTMHFTWVDSLVILLNIMVSLAIFIA
jgi:energy-coupling factor transport system permease protein